MPFEFILLKETDPAETQGEKRHYDQAVVKIGRIEGNDLILSDTKRMISGKHAEIRKTGSQFFLMDQSKNGTFVNGERLVSQKEHLLNNADQITIGEYRIQFITIQEESTQSLDETTFFPSEDKIRVKRFCDLQGVLSRLYLTHREADVQARSELYLSALHEQLDRIQTDEREMILSMLESSYAVFGEIQDPSLRKDEAAPPRAIPAQQIAYQGVSRIAEKQGIALNKVSDPNEVNDLLCRIDQVLDAMMKFLADAVKGRRDFQQEFDVEATRILKREINPIKLAEEGRQIGAYLWNKEVPIEKVIANLEDTFKDLALHQIGMLSGLQECLRGIMREMDPVTFLAKTKTGPYSLLAGLPIFKQWIAWGAFEKKHEAFSKEQVATFEKILGPFFSKGYMHVQKKK